MFGKISTEVVVASPPLSVTVASISNHVLGRLSGTGSMVNCPVCVPVMGPA